MPTPDTEIDAAARRVFERLGLWKPGLMCRDGWTRLNDDGSLGGFGTCEHHQQEPHEIPPPDPHDWPVFGHLLLATNATVGATTHNRWFAVISDDNCEEQIADDPRDALILALDAMLLEVK